MGVSGSGKSTLGERLAVRLGVPFLEGDDLHPAANVAAMAAGRALTDDDRWPWLATLRDWAGAQHTGCVLSCSALRRAYRDVLREAGDDVVFVHVDAPALLLAERMAARQGHFMPPALLASQLATLEPLGPDERGAVLASTTDLDTLVAHALAVVAGAT